jgi:hypothetical protein
MLRGQRQHGFDWLVGAIEDVNLDVANMSQLRSQIYVLRKDLEQ